MGTTEVGDIGEYAILLKALKRGWGVATPIGKPPYDLIFDIKGKLIKIQVKSAWFDKYSKSYKVDARRTRTNRRFMKRSSYDLSDFDFALCHILEKDLTYIIPIKIFISYKGSIPFVMEKRQGRKVAKSDKYKEAWDLIEDFK
jgi:hypothetical protein